MKFTDKIVADLTLRADERERLVADDDTPGLRLRLRRGAKGVTKRWVFKYARGGHQHSFTFAYPAHNLTAARKSAGELQARLRLGQDPARDRREGRARVAETMGAALQVYLPRKRAAVGPLSYVELERHLLKHARDLHGTPLAEITPAQLAAKLLPIATATSSVTFNNVRRSVHAFFAWAVKQGLVDRNPVIGLELHKVQSRDRVLSADELRWVWEATAGGSDYDTIVRLLLLSACRAGEIAGLRWGEIGADRIVIPGTRTKNGRQHVVPATAPIRELIESRSGEGFVFGRRRDRPFTGWGASKEALDARIAAAGHAMAGWRHHDLRRTAATGMGEMGISPHVIAMVLNHVSDFRGGVHGVYDRSSLESQVRQALTAWSEHVLEIAEGRVTGDRVVPFRVHV